MPRPWKFASLLALTALTLVVSFVFSRGSEGARAEAESSPLLDVLDPEVVVAATAAADRVSTVDGALAVVIPHHAVAASLIGRAVGAVRSVGSRTIVVIGPDHRNAGPARHTVGGHAWRWAGRTIATDPALVRGLEQLPSVRVSDAFIAGEHSVLTPLPFFAARFPATRIVLVTVRSGVDPVADDDLATSLDTLLGPHDLVVASVDFSHHRDFAAAQAEDARSRAALEAGTVDAYAALPVDAPAVLAIATRFAERRGARTFTILEQGNAALLLQAPMLSDTTGYLTGAWVSSGRR